METARRRRGIWLAAGALLILGGAAAAVVALTASSSSPRTGSGARIGSAPGATTLPGRQSAPAGPPGQPAPSREVFGVNVNRLFENPAFTDAAIAEQLRELRATGATVARTDALWEASEPAAPADGRHRYDWTFDDRIASALAAHGLRWLPIVDYTAGWDQSIPGADHSPPRTPADYAAYAAAFAARYGPGGAFWSGHPRLPPLPVDTIEIWNEPDNPAFWTPTPDLAAYVNLYLLARDAITRVQPGVRVLIGGLFQPLSSLPVMVRARPDLVDHVDGIAIHPYGNTPAVVVNEVREVRAALDRLGLGATPLYVTEYGWTTSPPGAHNYLPESLRPGYLTLTTAALGHTGCDVAAAIAYTWVTEDQDPSNPEQWFGINPPGGRPGADTRALTAGLAAARAPSPAGSCAAG